MIPSFHLVLVYVFSFYARWIVIEHALGDKLIPYSARRSVFLIPCTYNYIPRLHFKLHCRPT